MGIQGVTGAQRLPEREAIERELAFYAQTPPPPFMAAVVERRAAKLRGWLAELDGKDCQ